MLNGLVGLHVGPVQLASLALVMLGLGMYIAMSAMGSDSTAATLRARRPVWLARRRARAGIRHKHDSIGVGYRSALQPVRLTARELAHHGVLFGGPGSGKTTTLQLLIQATGQRVPVVVLDPKGSPTLAAAACDQGGIVWTLDGTIGADLLDPRPWQVPDLLLEAEEYSPEARVFRDAAHQRALWAAWALALRGERMDLQRLRELLDRGRLLEALQPCAIRDRRIPTWIESLRRRDGVEDSGAHDLQRALGTLLDGVAVRGALASGPGALRIDDVLQHDRVVLFSLDVADYPHATRKVAAWVLLAMGRLSRQLSTVQSATGIQTPRAVLLVDEVGALGPQARHLRGLVGRARETGLAVVLATQGPSDLEAVDRPLLNQVLQGTAWQLAFRQGSPADARQMEALFGHHPVAEKPGLSGQEAQQPRVRVDEWMNALEPGDAWLRVAPVDRGWRQCRVRVALPTVRKQLSERDSERASETKARALDAQFPSLAEPDWSDSQVARALPTSPAPMLPPEPPECPSELLERMGDDVQAKVERKWASPRRELGPCLVWREGEPTIKGAGGLYGRLYDPDLKRSDAAHLVVWRRCFPDKVIPKGWTVDHLCYVTLCQRPDHLQGPVTRAENTRRRHNRPRSANPQPAAPTFAIALFDGITRPTVKPRSASLDELVQLLGRFEVLADKRRGRCWSPTLYTTHQSRRGNAGVDSVSALVFDLDRVPPDPSRVEKVCWIGHTTWSHRPEAPRWRVVIPLLSPVAAPEWRNAWQRARLAFCPEADPACKDASRAYWLPSHPPGAHAAEAVFHPGPLLDATTVPPVPVGDNASGPSGVRPRLVADDGAQPNGRRGRAYLAAVVESLRAVRPGGRNAALNAGAWTLGRWVAAGMLKQEEVEDALFAIADEIGLTTDDGVRQTWATIRSGLAAGLREPVKG